MSAIKFNIHIRPATMDDLEDIARIHVTSWKETYVGQVPQSYLDDLNVPDRIIKWQEVLEGKTSEDKNLEIAFLDDEPVGFISYGQGRDSGMKGMGEIYAVYLLKETWGKINRS